MTWGTELRKVRRYLRDPAAKIWSDELIKHVWNQSQREFQDTTDILENVVALPVPPLASMSYMHDCEYAFLDSDDTNYRCLRHHQNWFSFTCAADAEVLFGNSPGATEAGAGYTHPHEAYLEQTNREPWHPWPNDLHQTKHIFFDNEPIGVTTRKAIASRDSSYIQRSGTPQEIFNYPDSDNAFSIYPRPTSFTWEDPAGTGMVTFVEGDTVAVEVGAIIQRTGTMDEGGGIAISVIDQLDNILVIYRILPKDVNSEGDILSLPDYLTKYVRYRVLERLYGANTDGRIPSLARLWAARYGAGLQAVKRFIWQRKRDRDYRLITKDRAAGRTRKHARLPDTYPAI